MDIETYLDELRDGYNESVTITDGVHFNTETILRRAEMMANSIYESGEKNELGLDKPFYNIVKYRVNVAVAATDLDTKDIDIYTDNPNDYTRVWLFKKEIRKWMKESNFAQTLNKISESRCVYGSAFLKRVERNGELNLEVCNIHNLKFDPSDFSESTPVFEKHYLTRPELYSKKDYWTGVEELLNDCDEKTFELWEVTGRMEGKYFDEEGFPMKKIIYTEVDGKKHILQEKTLDVFPYKKINWNTINGRSLGVGILEDGFQAQRWSNDIIQRQKEMLDLASKIIFRTDDDTLGNNVLTELQTGDVIKTKEGKSFNQVNTIPSAMPQFSQFLQQWDQQFERSTSTFGAFTGETMPSGTPYRSVAILNNAAGNIYQYKIEEFGLFLIEVFNDWVLPYLEKKLSKKHILADDFSQEELEMIDNSFATEQANNQAIEQMMQGGLVTEEQFQETMQGTVKNLRKTTKRYIDFPDNFFKGMESRLSINVSGEAKNKAIMFESLARVIGDISANPAILQSPLVKKLFARIIDVADIGISADEVLLLAEQEPQQPQQPQGQPQGQPQPGDGMSDLMGGILNEPE